MQQLLSKSNTKLEKSKEFGWKSYGMHLAPYKLSGKNFCSHASSGCAAACLNTAGHGLFPNVQESRIKKSQWFINKREEFMTNLKREIGNKVKTAQRLGQKISFRLNLTSDLPWESIKIDGKSLIDTFPEVQFMDYTKNDERMMKYLLGKMPKNYHLTFSKSEDNDEHCDIISGCGGNVAVVFRNKLPKTYKGKTVIDGDKNDMRFLDPKNVIVGLVAKGKAKKEDSGFVIETSEV